MKYNIYINRQQAYYIVENFNKNLELEQVGPNEFYVEIEEDQYNKLVDWVDEECYLMEEALKEHGHDIENDPDMHFLTSLYENLVEARNPDNY